MSFEYEQQIEHNGGRKKFSAYISTLWPDENDHIIYLSYERLDLAKCTSRPTYNTYANLRYKPHLNTFLV